MEKEIGESRIENGICRRETYQKYGGECNRKDIQRERCERIKWKTVEQNIIEYRKLLKELEKEERHTLGPIRL